MTSPRLGRGLLKPAGFYLLHAVFKLPKCKYTTVLNKFVIPTVSHYCVPFCFPAACELDWFMIAVLLTGCVCKHSSLSIPRLSFDWESWSILAQGI